METTTVSRRAFLETAGVLASVGMVAAVPGAALADAADEGAAEAVEHIDTDVAVIGSGGAGMCAALRCAMDGLKVTVFEKNGIIGGNSLICGGYIVVSGLPEELKADNTPELDAFVTSFIEEGPRDDEEAAVWDELTAQYEAWRASGSTKCFDSELFNDLDYARLDKVPFHDYEGVYERNTPFFEWFEDATGTPFDTAVGIIGYTYPRCVAVTGGKRGAGYFEYIQKAIDEKGLDVEVLVNTPVTSISVDDEGRVVGVRAAGPDGTVYDVAASRGVVVATGGFSANRQMLAQYNTDWPYSFIRNVNTDNSSGCTGDGVVMAEAAGAAKAFMSTYFLLPTCSAQDGLEVYDGLNYLLVNTEGKRFCNEGATRNEVVLSIAEQPDGMAYLLCDKKNSSIEDGMTRHGATVEALEERGRLMESDTVEGLAAAIGVDPSALEATLAAYNQACEQGEDPDFGNPYVAPEWSVSEAPLYAYPVAPASHITYGGIVVDEGMRVLRYDQVTPIEGLYAAGECRAGSTGLEFAMPDGRIAGESILAKGAE